MRLNKLLRLPTGSVLPSLLLISWLVSAGAGFSYLTDYHLQASPSGAVPPDWPLESALSLDRERNTLVMLLHPKCTCSKASVAELSRIMAKVGEHISPTVVFVAEQTQLRGVESSSLWQQANRIPDVQTFNDQSGSEAMNFGSLTSGQVALYNPAGNLLFQGGITASRGHEGDNRGAESIIELVRTSQGTKESTPVFGCGLFDNRGEEL